MKYILNFLGLSLGLIIYFIIILIASIVLILWHVNINPPVIAGDGITSPQMLKDIWIIYFKIVKEKKHPIFK